MSILRKMAASLAALTVAMLLFGAFVTSANSESPALVGSTETGSSMAFNAMPPGSMNPTVPDGMGMVDDETSLAIQPDILVVTTASKATASDLLSAGVPTTNPDQKGNRSESKQLTQGTAAFAALLVTSLLAGVILLRQKYYRADIARGDHGGRT